MNTVSKKGAGIGSAENQRRFRKRAPRPLANSPAPRAGPSTEHASLFGIVLLPLEGNVGILDTRLSAELPARNLTGISIQDHPPPVHPFCFLVQQAFRRHVVRVWRRDGRRIERQKRDAHNTQKSSSQDDVILRPGSISSSSAQTSRRPYPTAALIITDRRSTNGPTVGMTGLYTAPRGSVVECRQDLSVDE